MRADDHRPIVKALLEYGSKMDDWVSPIENIIKLTGSEANTFLLGVMLDRSIKAGLAWQTARWINDTLGDPDDVKALWLALGKIEIDRLEGFLRYGFGGQAFHKLYKTFARQLPEAAKFLIEKYDGDPRNIWNNERELEQVRADLEEIPGIGPALSRMAVLILARNYGLLGGKNALPQLDIKPDIHVMRVFKRCGFIEKYDKINDAIAAAQQLYKEFPAALDAPALKIGQEWCRLTKRVCLNCPIGSVCPQLD